MVRVLSPPYGTALEYGAGVAKGPLDLSKKFCRTLLRKQTELFVTAGEENGRTIDVLATNTFLYGAQNLSPQNLRAFNHAAVDIARETVDNRAIKIWGAMGPKGDCYTPSSDSVTKLFDYHMAQAHALRDADVDALLAETMGSVRECVAMVEVARRLEISLYLSVMATDKGTLLDGSALRELFTALDSFGTEYSPRRNTLQRVLVNCSSHIQTRALYEHAKAEGLLARMGGFYPNAAVLDHGEKNGQSKPKCDIDAEQMLRWTVEMLEDFADPQDPEFFVGGCCGTGVALLDSFLNNLPEKWLKK